MVAWKVSPKKLSKAIEVEMERRRRASMHAAENAVKNVFSYKHDPVGFCRDILGTNPTSQQCEILEALTHPPHQVMVRSANNVGKSYLSALASIWFYCTRDPSIVILTAPTFRQVVGVTFKEVRRLYKGEGLFPRAPRIETNPFHVLTGFTATDESSFQGLRERSNLIVFEECTGISAEIWSSAAGILSGGESAWLAIHNPTDSASQAYVEEQSGAWRIFSLSAFEHPNVLAELSGVEPPIPSAVRLDRLSVNMKKWGMFTDDPDNEGVDLLSPSTYRADRLPAEMIERTMAHFPGRYWTPTTPEGDSRVLGRYPRQSAYSVFSEWMFDRAERVDPDQILFHRTETPVIGCDVARFGDDKTVLHVRIGRHSILHESHAKRDTAQTANRLKELCISFAREFNCNPKRIQVIIDDTGVGGGVTDQKGDFNFVGVNYSERARDDERYDKVRSEVLFDLAERMRVGKVVIHKLPKETRQQLRQQAVGITYKLDNLGRRVAEPKAKMKERIGRSPDDLDAMALAYYELATFARPGEGIAVGEAPTSPFGTKGISGIPGVNVLPDSGYDKWNRR